jgi:hypothetical protein
MCESFLFSGNAQILAGEAEDYGVDVAESFDLLPRDLGDVA